MSSTKRRIGAAVGTSVVLAAMLTTGVAAAQDDAQPPLSCAQALQKLNAAQEAATDPAGPGKPADGTVITATEAAQIQAAIAAAIDPDGEGNDDGVPPAVIDDNGEEITPADTGDGAEITPAEQDAIDAAEAAATDPDGPGTPADGTVITDAEQAAINNAKRIADEACRGPQGEPGKAVNASVVVCVLRPGTCAEVKVDSEGRLIEIVREIQCNTDRLPTGTVRKGEKVVTVNRQVVTDPGNFSYELPSNLPTAPAPRIVQSDLPVTH